MPTVADVRLVPNAQPGFPEFTDAYITQKLTDALREYANMQGSTDYERIVTLAAAHELATEVAESGDGALGPVTAASAGGVSMSIGVEAIKAYSLAASAYGRALKRLIRINGPYSRVGLTPGSYR